MGAVSRSTWSFSRALAYGGAVVGVLDGLDALVFWGLRGASPIRVFQGVAAGLLGRDSFAGGVPTFLLGLLIHFFISFVVVTVYLLAARRIAALARKPWLYGLLYGVAVFFVMNYGVVPLSAAGGGGPPPFRLTSFLNGVIGHALLVGLPAALAAQRAFSRGERAAG